MEGVSLAKTTKWYQQNMDAYVMYLEDVRLRLHEDPENIPLREDISRCISEIKKFQPALSPSSLENEQESNPIELAKQKERLEELQGEMSKLEETVRSQDSQVHIMSQQAQLTRSHLEANLVANYQQAISRLPASVKNKLPDISKATRTNLQLQQCVFESETVIKEHLDSVRQENRDLDQKKSESWDRLAGSLDTKGTINRGQFVEQVHVYQSREEELDVQINSLQLSLSCKLEHREHLERDSLRKEQVINAVGTKWQAEREEKVTGKMEEPMMTAKSNRRLLGREDSSFGRWRWLLSAWLVLLIFVAVKSVGS